MQNISGIDLLFFLYFLKVTPNSFTFINDFLFERSFTQHVKELVFQFTHVLNRSRCFCMVSGRTERHFSFLLVYEQV